MEIQPRSVLIVDDNPADRTYTRIILKDALALEQFLEADTGEDALRLFRERERARAVHPDAFPPLLILLDINMPRMNGFEFLEAYEQVKTELESERITPPIVVMLSSSDNQEEIQTAMSFTSVDDYIVKPLSKDRARSIGTRYRLAPEA